MTRAFFGLLTLSAVAMPAMAQEENGRKVVVKHITEVDFTELELNGQLHGPTVGHVKERPRARFSPMIPLRHDFSQEMLESTQEMR
jgi:hypothetical protein